jgi:hypothetical protein
LYHLSDLIKFEASEIDFDARPGFGRFDSLAFDLALALAISFFEGGWQSDSQVCPISEQWVSTNTHFGFFDTTGAMGLAVPQGLSSWRSAKWSRISARLWGFCSK